MKKRITILFMAMLSLSVTSKAQWTVFDPSNLAQSIVNSAKEIVQTSSTAQNMLNNFQETVKIYQQGKAYYDALKSVHDLVKGARKVQQTILLVGDISDIYVTHFNTMMGDPNFTVEELSAIAFGYNRLLEESSNLLLDLKEVTTATGLSMTDKERLDIINRIYGEVLEYKNLTWYYTPRISAYRTCAARRREILKGYSPCTGHKTSVTGNHSSLKEQKNYGITINRLDEPA